MLRGRLAAWERTAERLAGEVCALGIAARDPRTPWYAKAVLLAVVGYAFSPVDPIPDFIPVVGYLDELLVVPLGVALARRFVPAPVMRRARRRADDRVAGGRARWLVAAVVVVGWLVLGSLLVASLAPGFDAP